MSNSIGIALIIVVRLYTTNHNIKIGKADIKRQPKDILFLTTGVMTQNVLEATKDLSIRGSKCGVLHFSTIKPLDHVALKKYLPKAKIVVTVEEHLRSGGFGSAILEFCNDFMPTQIQKISPRLFLIYGL